MGKPLFAKTIILVGIVALVCGMQPQKQAGIQVAAYVDKTEISLDGYVQLTVTLSGMEMFDNDPVSVEPLTLEESFTIVQKMQSMRVSAENGKGQRVAQFVYVLTPKQEGTLLIPSVTLKHKNESYPTEPIQITVLPASEPPAPREPSDNQSPSTKPISESKEGITI